MKEVNVPQTKLERRVEKEQMIPLDSRRIPKGKDVSHWKGKAEQNSQNRGNNDAGCTKHKGNKTRKKDCGNIDERKRRRIDCHFQKKSDMTYAYILIKTKVQPGTDETWRKHH